MIFDTHAHYDDERFNEDRRELLGQLPHLCAQARKGNISAKADGCPTRRQDYKKCDIKNMVPIWIARQMEKKVSFPDVSEK